MVAVFLFQLYQRLAVVCCANIQTAGLPLFQDMVPFAGQLFQEICGACAVFVCTVVFVVGKQQICHGVYYYKSAAPLANASSSKPVVNFFKRGGIQYAAQCAVAFVE